MDSAEANFAELRKGEVRSIHHRRTRVNRLSSDAPGARKLRILYDTQLPQVDVRCSFEHYVSLGTVFCSALMIKTLP